MNSGPSTARNLVGGYFLLGAAGGVITVLSGLYRAFGTDQPVSFIGLGIQALVGAAHGWAGLRILDGDRRGAWVAIPFLILQLVVGALAGPPFGILNAGLALLGLVLLASIRRELR